MSKLALFLLVSIGVSAFAQDETDDWGNDDWDSGGWDEDTGRSHWSGFAEAAYGRRHDASPDFINRETLSELRLRTELDWNGERWSLSFNGDLFHDDYLSETDGSLRELSLQTSLSNGIDLKIGRQVLTWGTGDLVFLNDPFPKSWQSFFAGRDDEYLKAPSDAARLTAYTGAVNIDVAWIPYFEPDEYLSGERFSFFVPPAGTIVAPSPPIEAVTPERSFENGELAVRLFKTSGSTEYALYLFRGFRKQPPFSPLSSLGGSLRRPLGKGLLNTEFVYLDSRDDRAGDDPVIPNGQFRWLLGYEFEAAPRFNVGFQYYLEATQDHAELIANSPYPAFEPKAKRQLLTNRLSYRLPRERLTLSLFSFYSPSDDDYYFRPTMDYRHSDRWSVSAGLNLFGGDRIHSFFGQLEDNSNAYIRARRSF